MRRLSYPLYLLENAPAGRLVEVASRRVVRKLVGLLPEAPRASEREILADFGVSRTRDLPGAFAEAIPGAWPFADPVRLRLAMEALRARLPEEVERTFAEAERTMERRVSIFGNVLSVPREERRVHESSSGWKAVAWERCPRTGKRASQGRFPSGVDPKDAWSLGRLDHVLRLALAARLLGDDERAEAWADAALDWCLDFCQAPRGIQWSSPMEVALRAANLAFTLRALAGTEVFEKRPGALLELLRGLDAHTAFVASRLEDTLVVPNNHLLANVVGTLVAGALVPHLSASRARAERLVDRFGHLVFEQTLEDGFSFEASTGYHRLAAELIALGVLAIRALGHELDRKVEARIRAVFRVSEKLRDGCGSAPQIGDEDSGQALPFRPRAARDQRHLGGIGRLLFSELPSKATCESLWLFGPHPVGPEVREEADVSFPSAGIYLLRAPRTSVSIVCGPNGTGGTGSHAHNDKLSIEVCLDGRRLIADPGSGRYTSDPALRNRLRGTAHHSTAMVDGREQQDLPPGRLFALPEQAHARCLLWEPRREIARFVGEHQGYHRLPFPVTHRRELRLHRETSRLAIIDTFFGTGEHFVEIRFLLPFASSCLRIRRATSHEANELGRTMRWVVEVVPKVTPVAILASALVPSLESGTYAEGYGQLSSATIVTIGARAKLPMTLRSFVSPVIES